MVTFGAIESAAHRVALSKTKMAAERLIGALTTMILRYLFPDEE